MEDKFNSRPGTSGETDNKNEENRKTEDSSTKRWSHFYDDETQGRKVTLCWQNVHASDTGDGYKCFMRKPKYAEETTVPILKGVSGRALPGQLLAVLGGSGSGKTILLHILTGRTPRHITATGLVTVNGRPLTERGKMLLSYVQQDDLFIGSLTVREHLLFQAELRMEQTVPYADKVKQVDKIMNQLGLVKCANALIGSPENLGMASGGERKCLALASELLTNPMLMILDEPTTGLDSFTTRNVVSVLSGLARSGKTIVCTIHQPSSEAYQYFHQIMLVAKGRTVFLGTASEAIDFFAENGMECPKNYNPADFLIHQISAKDSDQKKVETLCNRFDRSGYFKRVSSTFNSITMELKERSPSFVADPMGKFEYKTYCWTEMWILYRRAQLGVLRETGLTVIRLSQSSVIAFLLAIIYWGQKINQDSIRNFNGLLFLMVTSMSYRNAADVIKTFSLDFAVFRREYHSGICRAAPYFVAKTTADMPVLLLIPIVFTIIVYFSAGLRSDVQAFFNALAVLILVTHISCSFGYMISLMVGGNVKRALALLPVCILVLKMFGGFFLKNQSFPKLLRWIKYLSWFNFSFEILIINQWSDINHIECNVTHTCLKDGEDVINTLTFKKDNWNIDFCFLGVQLFCYRLIGLLALYIYLKYYSRG